MSKRFTDNKLLVAMLYSFINIFCMLIFYPVLPLLLNYPEGTVNTEFQRMIEGITYNEQFIIASIVLFVISLLLFLHELNKLERLKIKDNDENLLKLRKSCLTLPYKTYMIQIFVPTLLLLPILFFMGVEKNTIVSLSITVFALFSILAGFSLMFVKTIYTRKLVKTYTEYEKYEQNVLNKKYGVAKKILLQLIPTFFSAMLLFALIGYSKIIDEKGTALYQDYKFRLNTLSDEYENLNALEYDLNELLQDNDENAYFIVTDGDIYVSDNIPFSSEFVKYMDYYSKDNGGRVYDYYTSLQAATREIKLNSETIRVGLRYNVVSDSILVYYLISFIALALINLFILINFGKGMTFDIKTVSERLKKALNTDDIERISKIPITSDGEIGELEFAFNQILDLEKAQIQQIEQSQKTLVEQERLASLGQLAGGMAHDINTPIATIRMGIDFLSGKHDYSEQEVKMLEAMKVSASKITEIVERVRNQIRNTGESQKTEFSLNKVVDNIKVLVNNELQKNKCKLFIDSKEDFMIYGDFGKLSQILMNIVMNAIQAYTGDNGEIKISTYKENNNVVISVQDNAGGIPEKIAEGLFKEILTTKGTKGTGVGLYFANSMLRAEFNGEMTFETEEGIGSIFYIKIPTKEEE